MLCPIRVICNPKIGRRKHEQAENSRPNYGIKVTKTHGLIEHYEIIQDELI